MINNADLGYTGAAPQLVRAERNSLSQTRDWPTLRLASQLRTEESTGWVTQIKKIVFKIRPRNQVSSKARRAFTHTHRVLLCLTFLKITHQQQLYETVRYQRRKPRQSRSGSRTGRGVETGKCHFYRMTGDRRWSGSCTCTHASYNPNSPICQPLL